MEQGFDVSGVLERLTAVGFPANLEWELKVHSCFRPVQFFVRHEQFWAGDQLCCQVVIKLDEEQEHYYPMYYDACLRRQLDIPVGHSSTENFRALDQRMQLVDWTHLLTKGLELTVGNMSELTEVAQINQQLAELESLEEGAHIAHLMKLRYWMQTPFEVYVQGNAMLRSELEVNQRFHFFEGEDGITLNEAYRFLLHRWREKQLARKNRKADKGYVKVVEGRSSTSNTRNEK